MEPVITYYGIVNMQFNELANINKLRDKFEDGKLSSTRAGCYSSTELKNTIIDKANSALHSIVAPDTSSDTISIKSEIFIPNFEQAHYPPHVDTGIDTFMLNLSTRCNDTFFQIGGTSFSLVPLGLYRFNDAQAHHTNGMVLMMSYTYNNINKNDW